MSGGFLATLPDRWWADRGTGVPSICSAHRFVIEAALLSDGPLLIEATCNQVNHEGGYTGMTPAQFRGFVEGIAREADVEPGRILFGGDHLGPNPWKQLEADEAMARAARMVANYAEAGFTKIHLDTSMGCRGEPATLDDRTVAERAARLAVVAETAAKESGQDSPLYVIGTEVPPPGGATHAIAAIEVTAPSAVTATLEAHRSAFMSAGIEDTFERVIAVVVQPGVEFDHDHVFAYDRPKARHLCQALSYERRIVFEAHSTDYQAPDALSALVEDGFAILKVGPALSFAMREAFYGLDAIAAQLNPARQSLAAAMEGIMLAEPRYWETHYYGPPETLRLLRHFSYSDRIRYYWPTMAAKAAVAQLLSTLDAEPIPETLVSQFLPSCYPAVRDGRLPARPRVLVLEAIRQAIRPYRDATSPRDSGAH